MSDLECVRWDRRERCHTCYTQVAREGELQPATQSRTVDSRDGGHGQTLEFTERGAQIGEELGDLALGHATPLCQIGAGAE